MKKTVGFLLLFFLVVFTMVMFKITLPYTSFETDVDFLLTKQYILYNKYWRYGFYFHIFSSVFILILGGLQFIPFILKKYPQTHKTIGKLYVFLVLIVSAPGALIMSLYANGGFLAKCSFLIVSVLWFVFTAMAFIKILNKNVEAHIKYTVLSYALTLSAITLRLYVLVLPSIVHLRATDMYTLVAWLSWIPNLIFGFLFWKKIKYYLGYQY